MSDRIEEITINFMVRNMPAHGPTSSEKMNDLITETGTDLVTIQDQWNNRLVPLTVSLPYGQHSADVDAFTNGLDGKSLYVDQEATASNNSTYFNSTASRPNTVYEQMEAMYASMRSLEESLTLEVGGLTAGASVITFSDHSDLYNATNVEAALTEVMNAVNALDLSEGAASIRRLTTTQRDQLSPENGMVIYNTSTNKFQGYENGSWTNLI